MNLIIPIAYQSKFFSIEDYGYPKPLIEISGKPLIQHVIENVTHGVEFEKIIFIVREDDCRRYHIDSTLELLSPSKPIIIRLTSDTKGALCSVLWAIEEINNDSPLVISNADQIFDDGISDLITGFMKAGYDAACATFNSVHPRWSYIRLDETGDVNEAIEKVPISRHAIAGLYMYRKGSDFVKYGINSIKNGASFEGQFYVAPVFNEFILGGKKVCHLPVRGDRYHTFYSPQKVEEYEVSLSKGLL